MTRRWERAEFLNRLCELRDAYGRRGPDDRESSVTLDALLEQLPAIWENTQVATEPSAQ